MQFVINRYKIMILKVLKIAWVFRWVRFENFQNYCMNHCMKRLCDFFIYSSLNKTTSCMSRHATCKLCILINNISPTNHSREWQLTCMCPFVQFHSSEHSSLQHLAVLMHRYHGNLIGTISGLIVLLSTNQNWVILLSVL